MKNGMDYYLNCPICYKETDTPITTKCGHNFCSECVFNIRGRCPICATSLNITDFYTQTEFKTDNTAMKNIFEINTDTHSKRHKYNDENIYNQSTACSRRKRKHNELGQGFKIDKKFSVVPSSIDDALDFIFNKDKLNYEGLDYTELEYQNKRFKYL